MNAPPTSATLQSAIAGNLAVLSLTAAQRAQLDSLHANIVSQEEQLDVVVAEMSSVRQSLESVLNRVAKKDVSMADTRLKQALVKHVRMTAERLDLATAHAPAYKELLATERVAIQKVRRLNLQKPGLKAPKRTIRRGTVAPKPPVRPGGGLRIER